MSGGLPAQDQAKLTLTISIFFVLGSISIFTLGTKFPEKLHGKRSWHLLFEPTDFFNPHFLNDQKYWHL